MSTPTPAPTRATDTELSVVAAHKRAVGVATAWARAPLNPAAQEAALAYLLGPAASDRVMVARWMDDNGAAVLRRRLHALIAGDGSD
jgi:hypothetical protein